jgi:hypothetical protein
MSPTGYDMFWTNPPDNKAESEAARQDFNQAIAMRDKYERDSEEHVAAQVLVQQAYDALQHSQPEYFRLNIWGMSSARETMRDFGMICEAEPHTREQWDEVNERAEKTDDEAEREEIYRWILTDHNGECPGIPWWKLSDNSGWYVLPAEIRPALHAYLTRRKNGQEPPDYQWWSEWIEWLGAAAEHGGFRVF